MILLESPISFPKHLTICDLPVNTSSMLTKRAVGKTHPFDRVLLPRDFSRFP